MVGEGEQAWRQRRSRFGSEVGSQQQRQRRAAGGAQRWLAGAGPYLAIRSAMHCPFRDHSTLRVPASHSNFVVAHGSSVSTLGGSGAWPEEMTRLRSVQPSRTMKLERVFSARSWKDSPDSWYRSPANISRQLIQSWGASG